MTATVLKMTSDERLGRLAAHYAGRSAIVTGGFGFIGSHLTRSLLDLGVAVTVLDLRTDESVPSLINDPVLGLRRKCTIVKGDIGDSKLLDEVLSKGDFNFIFNLASYATVIEKAIENPAETIETNTIGLVNILEAVRRHGLSPLRIVHASTDKVYGEMGGEPYEEEKTPLRGIGIYDSSKLAADLFTRTYHEVYGLPTVVLRLCNIFGPSDFNTKHRLIPRALTSLYGQSNPRPPELYFDSIEHCRDYLYIDDLVRAFLLVAFRHECSGETFNLAAVKFASTPEMLKIVVQMAAEIEREYDPVRADQILSGGIAVRVRPHDSSVLTISKQRLNSSKLTRMTEFEPSISFYEGLSRTIRAYRDHYLGMAQPEANGAARYRRVQTAAPIQPSA
jgi:nucleoside-diphosphate-sugar epimerase